MKNYIYSSILLILILKISKVFGQDIKAITCSNYEISGQQSVSIENCQSSIKSEHNSLNFLFKDKENAFSSQNSQIIEQILQQNQQLEHLHIEIQTKSIEFVEIWKQIAIKENITKLILNFRETRVNLSTLQNINANFYQNLEFLEMVFDTVQLSNLDFLLNSPTNKQFFVQNTQKLKTLILNFGNFSNLEKIIPLINENCEKIKIQFFGTKIQQQAIEDLLSNDIVNINVKDFEIYMFSNSYEAKLDSPQLELKKLLFPNVEKVQIRFPTLVKFKIEMEAPKDISLINIDFGEIDTNSNKISNFIIQEGKQIQKIKVEYFYVANIENMKPIQYLDKIFRFDVNNYKNNKLQLLEYNFIQDPTQYTEGVQPTDLKFLTNQLTKLANLESLDIDLGSAYIYQELSYFNQIQNHPVFKNLTEFSLVSQNCKHVRFNVKQMIEEEKFFVFKLDSCNKNQCAEKQYFEDNKCKSCSIGNCLNCEKDQCLQCGQGYGLDETKQCVQCKDQGCKYCSDNGNVCNEYIDLKCRNGMIQVENECKCPLDSKSGKFEGEDYCIDTSYLQQSGQYCPSYCSSCDSEGKCVACADENNRDNKNGVCQCSINAYMDIEGSNICKKCTAEEIERKCNYCNVQTLQVEENLYAMVWGRYREIGKYCEPKKEVVIEKEEKTEESGDGDSEISTGVILIIVFSVLGVSGLGMFGVWYIRKQKVNSRKQQYEEKHITSNVSDKDDNSDKQAKKLSMIDQQV